MNEPSLMTRRAHRYDIVCYYLSGKPKHDFTAKVIDITDNIIIHATIQRHIRGFRPG
jgi:hypothetical protein